MRIIQISPKKKKHEVIQITVITCHCKDVSSLGGKETSSAVFILTTEIKLTD